MQPNPPKLGQGLSALLAPKSVPVSSDNNAPSTLSGVRYISVTKIKPGKWQPRRVFNDQEIESLADSIRQNGVLQPILVRHNADEDIYEIIAGERRWRASLRAQISEMPALVKDLDEVSALTVALVENIQREDLSPLEEAEGYQKLITEIGLTQEQLSKAVGKSRPHIANTLRLLQLPQSIQSILHNSEITPGHARCLIGLSEHESLRIIDEIIQKKLNVRQVERLIRLRQSKGADVHKKTKSAAGLTQQKAQAGQELSGDQTELQHLADTLSFKLGLPAEITLEKSGGKVSLMFQSFQELDALLQKISTLNGKL